MNAMFAMTFPLLLVVKLNLNGEDFGRLFIRHCEEQSDEAIQFVLPGILECFACDDGQNSIYFGKTS
jgi:hypothetical protein